MTGTLYKETIVPEDEPLYTADEVAKQLRVTPKTVRMWCRTGEMEVVLLSGRWYRIPKSAVDAKRTKRRLGPGGGPMSHGEQPAT